MFEHVTSDRRIRVTERYRIATCIPVVGITLPACAAVQLRCVCFANVSTGTVVGCANAFLGTADIEVCISAIWVCAQDLIGIGSEREAWSAFEVLAAHTLQTATSFLVL
jgi:hypothetical protein